MVPDGSALALVVTTEAANTTPANKLRTLDMKASLVCQTITRSSEILLAGRGDRTVTHCARRWPLARRALLRSDGPKRCTRTGMALTSETRIDRGARVIGLAMLAALALVSPAPADDYFKGKTVRLVVGTPPGGGYDTYGRLVARHLGEYLPGHPTVIVVNMAGASGMNAVHCVYYQAPRDGTVIATFNKSMPFYQALGQQGVRFKAEQLSFIGSMSQDPDVVSV